MKQIIVVVEAQACGLVESLVRLISLIYTISHPVRCLAMFTKYLLSQYSFFSYFPFNVIAVTGVASPVCL
jgi:hypothetical protein